MRNYADEGAELILRVIANSVMAFVCVAAAPAIPVLWCLGWIRVRIREARK